MEMSEDGEWERMIADYEAESALEDDAVLRRAFREAQMEARGLRSMTPVRPMRAGSPPGLEPAQMEGETGLYRPMYDATSPTLRRAKVDPYPPASPRGYPAPGRDGDQKAADSSDASRERPRTSPVHPGLMTRERTEHVRVGVKEATKHRPDRTPQHQDLGERLQAKRDSLRPFGIRKDDKPGPPEGTEAPAPEPRPDAGTGQAGAPARVLLENDDPDLDGGGMTELE